MAEPVTGERDWEKLLDEQAASGLSVAAWCVGAGIKPHLIYPRKRERAAGKAEQGASKERAARKARGARKARKARRAGFVPVTVTTTMGSKKPPARLRVHVAGGRTIEIESDIDTALLARVVLALEALPCS